MTTSTKKIIIFIGPPGSGKGTQAKKIAEKYHYYHLSTGDILRNLDKNSQSLTSEDIKVLDFMKKGELVPDADIIDLVKNAFTRFYNNRGVVLDGAIRNIEQAETMQKFFEAQNLLKEIVVIDIYLSDEQALDRLSKRQVCPNCGYIVSGEESKKNLTVCPRCSHQLKARADDSPEIIKKRITQQGNVALEPIREFYKKLGILRGVDGNQAVSDVARAIEENICS